MLPGTISYKLFLTWKGEPHHYSVTSFIDIFIFSIIDYLVVDFFLVFYFSLTQGKFVLIDSSLSTLLSENSPISFPIIFTAAFIGVIVAIISTLVVEQEYLTKLSEKLKFSNAISPNSVWTDFFKNNEDWVIVRDSKTKSEYLGRVDIYSKHDNADFKELLLKEVTVTQEDTEPYEVSALLLIRKADDLTIEVGRSINTESSENNESSTAAVNNDASTSKSN